MTVQRLLCCEIYTVVLFFLKVRGGSEWNLYLSLSFFPCLFFIFFYGNTRLLTFLLLFYSTPCNTYLYSTWAINYFLVRFLRFFIWLVEIFGIDLRFFCLLINFSFFFIFLNLHCITILMLQTVNKDYTIIFIVSSIIIPFFYYTVTLSTGCVKWLSTIIEIALDTSAMILWSYFANWAGQLKVFIVKFVFINNFICIDEFSISIRYFFEPYFFKVVYACKVIPVSTIDLHDSSFEIWTKFAFHFLNLNFWV